MMSHTEQQPHACDSCKARFSNEKDLKMHMKKHAPHACVLCEARFSEVAELETHILTHTEYKPFGCNLCGVSFSQSAN